MQSDNVTTKQQESCSILAGDANSSSVRRIKILVLVIDSSFQNISEFVAAVMGTIMIIKMGLLFMIKMGVGLRGDSITAITLIT